MDNKITVIAYKVSSTGSVATIAKRYNKLWFGQIHSDEITTDYMINESDVRYNLKHKGFILTKFGKKYFN